MSWKKIIGAKKRKPDPNPDQLSLLDEDVEEQESPKQVRGRSAHHWFRGYTASGPSHCSTHPSECPEGGEVKEGHQMVVIGPLKGVLPAGVEPVLMYCHQGICAQTALAGADRRVEESIGS